MSNTNPSKPTSGAKEREYEKSGMYPDNDKPFRILALLGWLAGIVVCLAGAAAILNIVLL